MAKGFIQIADLPARGPGSCGSCGGVTPDYRHAAVLRHRQTALGAPRDPFRLCQDCASPVVGSVQGNNMVHALEVLLDVATDGHPVARQALRQALVAALPRFLEAVREPVSVTVNRALPDLTEDAGALVELVVRAVLDEVLPPVSPGTYDHAGRPVVPDEPPPVSLEQYEVVQGRRVF